MTPEQLATIQAAPLATVEAACESFYNDPSGLTSWERATRVSPEMADRYRVAMTRALEAAHPALLAIVRSQQAQIERVRELIRLGTTSEQILAALNKPAALTATEGA